MKQPFSEEYRILFCLCNFSSSYEDFGSQDIYELHA